MDCGKGACFDLRDGVGGQVQSLQRNIWLELMHEQIRDSIVDSKSQRYSFRTLVTKRKSRLSHICFSYLSQSTTRQRIFIYPTTDYEIAFKCEELDNGGGGVSSRNGLKIEHQEETCWQEKNMQMQHTSYQAFVESVIF